MCASTAATPLFNLNLNHQPTATNCPIVAQDSLAFKAFQNEGILTMGADHFEVDWEGMWRERLADSGKATGGCGLVGCRLGWVGH
jgi:hypothetical protein